MALNLLSTARQNQQNQLEREGFEKKQGDSIPTEQEEITPADTRPPQRTPVALNNEFATNNNEEVAVKEESVIPKQEENAGTRSSQLAPEAINDGNSTNNNEEVTFMEEAVIPEQLENAGTAQLVPPNDGPSTKNNKKLNVKGEVVIQEQGENDNTLTQQLSQLPSTHKRKLPVDSPSQSEEPDVDDGTSGENDEASSSRPTFSVRAKKTRFLSRFIPNEEQTDYEKKKEYFSDITKDLKEVGTYVLGSNGKEFLILTIEEDKNQEDGKKTEVHINMVKANPFKQIFRLIRAELKYRTSTRLKKADVNTWVEDAFKFEKEQMDCKFTFPPTFFNQFSDVIKNILDYESNKKNPKEKRAEAGRIHELVLKKLDDIADTFGYCCGQKRLVKFEGYVEPFPEPEIRCRRCWKEFHVQCVQWNSIVDGPASDFVCRGCSPRPRRSINMEKLQKTPSSIFIENGINEFLETLENVSEVPGKMSCRLFVCLRSEEMSDHEKQRFSGIYNLMDKVPRTFKVYGVTQEDEGQDVLVFLMAVNEYSRGVGVPKHKEGIVSFEFIDTVKYLKPPQKSREINQKLLRLYLQNAQQRGFTKARIHASAPGSKEYDFMFNNRPQFKKNLNQKGLFDWYKENMEKLVVDMERDGVQMTYQHVFDPSHHRSVKTICEELYMAEGFWPVFLERNQKMRIKEFKEKVEQESRSRDDCQFYIRFEDLKEVQTVAEEDPFIASTIAASRFAWMHVQRENTWLFDTLRHAKFSTMMLLSTLEMERESGRSSTQSSDGPGEEIDENEVRNFKVFLRSIVVKSFRARLQFLEPENCSRHLTATILLLLMSITSTSYIRANSQMDCLLTNRSRYGDEVSDDFMNGYYIDTHFHSQQSPPSSQWSSDSSERQFLGLSPPLVQNLNDDNGSDDGMTGGDTWGVRYTPMAQIVENSGFETQGVQGYQMDEGALANPYQQDGQYAQSSSNNTSVPVVVDHTPVLDTAEVPLPSLTSQEIEDILNAEIEGDYIDTKDLCVKISADLLTHEISQSLFSKRIINRSQGTLSDLLKKPKPWSSLRDGRKTFARMYNWMSQPLETKMAILYGQPVGSVLEMTPSTTAQKGSKISKVSSAQQKPKKVRLVFTETQKRTLEKILSETRRPDRKMKQQIAGHLLLDYTTVDNFFMNARRRRRPTIQTEEQNIPVN
ncbi:unnamed protein product [Caenorhabditis brenneri]